MHSALNHASKMFQSSVDVVWMCSRFCFRVVSKMFEDVFKIEGNRKGNRSIMDRHQIKCTVFLSGEEETI